MPLIFKVIGCHKNDTKFDAPPKLVSPNLLLLLTTPYFKFLCDLSASHSKLYSFHYIRPLASTMHESFIPHIIRYHQALWLMYEQVRNIILVEIFIWDLLNLNNFSIIQELCSFASRKKLKIIFINFQHLLLIE